jgi:SSS family solute:Na+ symporter
MDNTATVFPRLAADVLPPVAAGFIAAIVFGAAISTFNAGLNSSGTLYIMNLYKPWKDAGKKEVNERQLVKASKWFQILVVLLGICIAPFIALFKGGFYTYIQMVSSFFSIPVFTVLAVGFLTRRVPALAAKVGLLFFVLMYALSQFVFETNIHYLHVLAILFLMTTALMLVIGKMMPMEVPYQRERMAIVDLKPWKNRYWYNGILILLMILLFVLFSPLGLAK